MRAAGGCQDSEGELQENWEGMWGEGEGEGTLFLMAEQKWESYPRRKAATRT